MNASLVAYSIMFSCLSIYFSMKMGMDDDSTDSRLAILNDVAAIASAIAAVALGIEAILTPC